MYVILKTLIIISLFAVTAFSCKHNSSDITKFVEVNNRDIEVALQDAVLIDTNDLIQGKLIYNSYDFIFTNLPVSEIPSLILQELKINQGKSSSFYSPDKKTSISLDTASKGFMIFKSAGKSSLSVQGSGWKTTSITWENDSLIFLNVFKEGKPGKFNSTPDYYKIMLR